MFFFPQRLFQLALVGYANVLSGCHQVQDANDHYRVSCNPYTQNMPVLAHPVRADN